MRNLAETCKKAHKKNVQVKQRKREVACSSDWSLVLNRVTLCHFKQRIRETDVWKNREKEKQRTLERESGRAVSCMLK